MNDGLEKISSVSILPCSDERALCISFSGLISKEEYDKNFYVPLKKIVDDNDEYRLLIHYDKDYKGWDRDAADSSFKAILEIGARGRRMAYVNPPESKIFQVKLSRNLFAGDIEFFDDADLDKAIAWVKA